MKNHYTFVALDNLRQGEKINIHKSDFVVSPILSEHNHDFFEVFYVLSGEAYHVLNGKRTYLKEGDLVFLSYYATHSLERITENVEWISIAFMPEFIDESLINKYTARDLLKISVFKQLNKKIDPNLYNILLNDVREEFEGLFLDMYREYQKQGQEYLMILKMQLTVLLAKIFRCARTYPEGNESGEEFVNLVLSELEEKNYGDINLSSLAKEAYLSPKYFSKLFKDKVGKSLTDFLHEYRIQRACELLENTDKSVAEIMSEVGYKDPKFFYSLFKRLLQMSPKEYRKSAREKR